MINDLFSKKKYIKVKQESEQNEFAATVPDGMWEKCSKCLKVVYEDDLYASMKVCPHCGHHFRLSARQRIACTVDEHSFSEWNESLCGSNPLSFPGYDEKLKSARALTGLNDAVLTGSATIGGKKTALAVMDGNFMMGSMGFAVGEKITLAVERAMKEQLPIIIFTVSGGARMQEGMVSLMQMAKVSSALQRFSQMGLLYITVLTDPTTGGVSASFAMLGDIILSEPNALVGFAGRRVIEQTIRQTLPEDFQTAEFVLSHGFIDAIVTREKMAQTLTQLLHLHERGNCND